MAERQLTPLKTAYDSWTCPSCENSAATPHCPVCGERAPNVRDLTLRGVGEQLVRAFIRIDGRMIRSFQYAVTRPGMLTVAFQRGQRKPYLMPLPMFFIANVLFFAMQTLTETKIFSTPLDMHLRSDIWGPLADRLITRHLQAANTTIDLYAPVFNQAVAVNSKSLIILMALSIVFYRSHPFAVHVVFSLHLYVFVLMLCCVALTIVGVDAWFGGEALESANFDHALSIIQLLACATYLYKAIGTVYGARGAGRVLKVFILTVGVAFIFLAYRFALLPITLYRT